MLDGIRRVVPVAEDSCLPSLSPLCLTVLAAEDPELLVVFLSLSLLSCFGSGLILNGLDCKSPTIITLFLLSDRKSVV